MFVWVEFFEVIFVGCGHGCDLAARILAKAGKKVAAVERDLWMGTCTNYGCNAKILLDGPFELTTAMENYRQVGVFPRTWHFRPKPLTLPPRTLGTSGPNP